MGVRRWEGGLERVKEREDSKMTSRSLAWVTTWVVVPFTEKGHTRGKTTL